jgi:hypothetical protein
MAHKAVVIGGAVLGVFALVGVMTNPSLTDFKAQRASQDGITGVTCNSVETSNYVVFSRYEYRCMMSTTKYVGAFGNYYELKDAKAEA